MGHPHDDEKTPPQHDRRALLGLAKVSAFVLIQAILLFLAAVTSSLSMLQPAIALMEEGLGLGRKASVALLGFITAVGAAFVVYFSENLLALDTLDFWIGSFAIYILATAQVILFGWVLGIDRGFEELNRGAEIRIPGILKYIIKYVSPTYLLIIFGFWCYKNIPAKIAEIRAMSPEDRGTVLLMLAFIGLLLGFFAMLANLANKRWHLIGKLPLEPARGFPVAAANEERSARS